MADPALEPFVFGTSHVVAAADVREDLHLPEDAVADVARELLDGGVLAEVVPLSTCGRLELYGVGAPDDRTRDLLHDRFVRHTGVPVDVVRLNTFHHRRDQAVRHAFRVAAGLDSVVHGEAQILGQVRRALDQARAASTTGPVTERMFQSALAAGKRVRSETDLGRGTASLAGAALALIRHRVNSLEGLTAVVVGAGETGALVARLLRKAGVGSLVVANRTEARATRVASSVGGLGVGMGGLSSHLGEADLVVAAVRGIEGLLGPSDFAGLPGGRARHLVDLSHPRAFDPAVGRIDGIHLVDLQAVAREAHVAQVRRLDAVPDAEAIVEAEVRAFARWLGARASVPVLRALRTQVLDQALDEAERRIGSASPEVRDEARRLARAVARALLHQPTVALRGLDATSEEGRRLLEAATTLFDLPVSEEEAR